MKETIIYFSKGKLWFNVFLYSVSSLIFFYPLFVASTPLTYYSRGFISTAFITYVVVILSNGRLLIIHLRELCADESPGVVLNKEGIFSSTHRLVKLNPESSYFIPWNMVSSIERKWGGRILVTINNKSGKAACFTGSKNFLRGGNDFYSVSIYSGFLKGYNQKKFFPVVKKYWEEANREIVSGDTGLQSGVRSRELQ